MNISKACTKSIWEKKINNISLTGNKKCKLELLGTCLESKVNYRKLELKIKISKDRVLLLWMLQKHKILKANIKMKIFNCNTVILNTAWPKINKSIQCSSLHSKKHLPQGKKAQQRVTFIKQWWTKAFYSWWAILEVV